MDGGGSDPDPDPNPTKTDKYKGRSDVKDIVDKIVKDKPNSKLAKTIEKLNDDPTFKGVKEDKTLNASAAFRTVRDENGKIFETYIVINPDKFDQLTEAGKRFDLSHEFNIHANNFLNRSSDADYLSQSNDVQHQNALNNPDYLQGLRDAIPGKDEGWYDAAKFLGLDPEGQLGTGPITQDMTDKQLIRASHIGNNEFKPKNKD